MLSYTDVLIKMIKEREVGVERGCERTLEFHES